MSKGAYDIVYDFYKRLQGFSRVERRKLYASPEFPAQVESIAKTLKAMAFPNDQIKSLVSSAMQMRTASQQMSGGEMNWLAQGKLMPGTADTNDSFFMWYDAIIQQLNQGMNTVIGQEIMRKIDDDFSEPIHQLAEAIPNDLKDSKEYLLGAVESFRKGSKEEASVRTRKAWESCVTFALSKLPKKGELTSLEKKSVYVLEQIGMQDKSKSVAKIKGLYEGRFLHALDAEEVLPEPELPFYIALTTGFVHLVSRMLEQ